MGKDYLKEAKHAFDELYEHVGEDGMKDFFSSVVWHFFEVYMTDYYHDDGVAEDDDVFCLLDDEWNNKDWECQFDSRQQAFDIHVRLWREFMKEASSNMFRDIFRSEAKVYGLKYEE